MADEDQSDDGALHALFQGLPPEVVLRLLALLVFLSRVRVVTPDIRARAQALADDPLFPQRDHPIVQRILAAP